MNGRYSKLAFLHRVKERKTPSLSAQASFAPFFLKVAWSGKSLIVYVLECAVHHYPCSFFSRLHLQYFPLNLADGDVAFVPLSFFPCMEL